MKSKQVAILALLLISGVGISRVAFAQEPNGTRQSTSEKQVIAGERAIWNALKNKDYAYLRPSPAYMMTVWQRKGGKWVPVAHSETPAKSK